MTKKDPFKKFIVEHNKLSPQHKLVRAEKKIKELVKEKKLDWKKRYMKLCKTIEERPIEIITDKKRLNLMKIFGIEFISGGPYGEGFIDCLDSIKRRLDKEGQKYLLKVWNGKLNDVNCVEDER